MDSSSSSSPSCPSNGPFDSVLSQWKEWQITVFMMLTMVLQLVMVMTGAFRKLSASDAIHFVVWISFVSLDTIAMYALGLMLGSSCDSIFTLWAPILLFHLGASDMVSSYSEADNDLWKRHRFKMSIEVIVAIYIILRSRCQVYTIIGILLFIVGAIKYGERITAMHNSSRSQIIKSARPVYKFMSGNQNSVENRPHNLLVMGENEWYTMHLSDDRSRSKSTISATDATVTYEDIRKCKELKKASYGCYSRICLAYALYKIFRRRLTNLHIHEQEGDYDKMRELFFTKNLTPAKIIGILDLELSFIFDGLYTKAAGTAFTGIGVFFRTVSALLLIGAAVYLVRIDFNRLGCNESSVHLAGALTHVLVSIAVILEAAQILRMMRSNWTRVWLACTYVKEKRRSNQSGVLCKGLHNFTAKVILFSVPLVGIPRNVHWRDEAGQLSLMRMCFRDISWLYLIRFQFGRVARVRKLEQLLDSWKKEDEDEVSCYRLELFLLERMIETLKEIPPKDLSDPRNRMTRLLQGTLQASEASEFAWAGELGIGHSILNWHVATSICELVLLGGGGVQEQSPGSEQNSGNEEEVKDIFMGSGLSRYAFYLLVERPKLLPDDPDVAKLNLCQARHSLTQILWRHRSNIYTALVDEYKPFSEDPEAIKTSFVDAGFVLARKLLAKPPCQRWKILAQVWCQVLTNIAITENASPHTHQISRGGELLTHLWVLLGHMGYGYRH